jgi:S1/P1 Nuclease
MKFAAVVFFGLVGLIILFSAHVSAWNIPGHMLSGAIAYQVLQRRSPATIETVRSIVQLHPWYESPWRVELAKLPQAQRDEVLFMLAARWADNIRTTDRFESHPEWHYINWPFKPEDEPASVETKPPERQNILTAIEANEWTAARSTDGQRRAMDLTWLFHLVGDIHQPLRTIALYTREYPHGDRGGNEACVRVTQNRAPLALHRLWDDLLTSSNNTRTIRNLAIGLRNKFSRAPLTELANTEPEAWAKESFEIAQKVAYQNGALRGTPKGQHKDCREVPDVPVLPDSYLKMARQIADRRMMLAGYRLADLLQRTIPSR